MNEQRRYKEPKDTLWGKCLTTFIAIVFAMSTLTIIPIAGATVTPEQADAAKEAADEMTGKVNAANEDGDLELKDPEPIEILGDKDKKDGSSDVTETVLGAQATEENGPEADDTVPAEVQAFLDAVAAIPEITPENAAEVAEYVYGPVSEAYEVLLGTEYEERADVLKATEAYGQAIADVDAMLDMESDTFATQLIQGQFNDVSGKTITIRPNRVPADYSGSVSYRYREFNNRGNPTTTIKTASSAVNRIGAAAPVNNAGAIEKMVGEQGIFQRCPHNTFVGSNCGHTIGQAFAPMGYCDIKVNLSEADIVDNISYGIGSFDRQMANAAGVGNLAGAECLKVTYDANRPGRTTFTQTYYVNFLTSIVGGYCSCGRVTSNQTNFSWHQYTDTFDVNVYAYYTVNFIPGGDGVTNMPSNVTSSKQFTDAYVVTTQQPQREGYTFNGWVDDKGNNVGTNAIAKWYEGDGAYVTRTLTAQWVENDPTPTAPTAPTREDLFGILGNFVKVKCVSEGDGLPHAEKSYSINTYYSQDDKYESSVGNVYEADGTYKVDVTLNGDVYAGLYGFEPSYGTGVPHALKDGEDPTQTITLTWDANNEKWVGPAAKGTVLATFQVVCKKPTPKPSLTKLDKERLTAAPEDVALNLQGKTVNYDQNVVFVGDNAPAVTLLYKLTVTGEAGAAYKVTDKDATWVGGDPMEGTIATGKTEAVIYVTKTFAQSDVVDGKLVNNAKLEAGNDNTTGPKGENGNAGTESGAKKQYNVTVNFKTDDGAELQDPSTTTVDEGADFNYRVGQTAARMVRAASATGSDVNAVVIPQRLGANNEYVLDEVASAEGLAKLAAAKNITADIVADIIYSLDTKGTIGTDPETGDPTDTSDGIPDKYQVKVTYKVVNGAWNDESTTDVVAYLNKYVDGKYAENGTAILGDTIPAAGEKPTAGYEADGWNAPFDTNTTISSDIEYTYTYNLITYNISYALDGGTVNGTNPATYTVKSDDITLINPTKVGYTFTGWTGTGLTGATTGVTIAKGSTGDRSYTATWSANGDTAYTVEHYQQNLDGTYTLVETENLTGATDSTVNATVKTYEGFTHNRDAAGTLLQSTIAADGSTVLRVYYDRNTYTVGYDLNGGSVEEGVQTTFEGVKYGDDTPTIPDPTRTGYTFTGWDPAVAETVTGNATYVAQWTPLTFDIDVEVVNGTSDADTVGTTVNYGGDVTYTFTPNAGYVLESVTVDGNPAALSANGTFTFNAVTEGHSIVVTYAPAPVIPTPTPDNPTPTPTPTPGPTPGATTTPVAPDAGVAAAATPAAAAAVAAVEAIGDEGNPLAAVTVPEEELADDANAMAAFEGIHCWTHWLMIFGALVTIVYGLGVLYMRRRAIHDFDDFEDDATGRKYDARKAPSRVTDGAPQTM